MKTKEEILATPPWSEESEQGVLGCCILSEEVIGDAIAVFKGNQVFYDLRHATIWRHILKLYNDGSGKVDSIILSDSLRASGEMEEAGGLAYWSALPDAVPSAANIGHYAQIVWEKFAIRQAIGACSKAVHGMMERNAGIDVLNGVRDAIDIVVNNSTKESKTTIALVQEAIDKIESIHEKKGITGIRSGFVDIDKMLTGFHEEEMIVIAARPSIGKTSLAMNIADYVAVDCKIPTAVFSLEMSASQLMMRQLCSRARVNMRNITDGFMTERDFPKLTGAAGKIAHAPLFIEDQCGMTISGVRARARQLRKNNGVRLVIIDYLQLLKSNRRTGNRQEEVAEISSGIKEASKELGIAFVVLSQLNRDLEKKKTKPTLAHLKESGAIEQDADVVMLMSNEEKRKADEEENWPSDCIPIMVDIAKQRNGPTGLVSLSFVRGYTRFENVAKVSEEDLPVAYKD